MNEEIGNSYLEENIKDLKRVNERYDDYLNEVLPADQHRGDVVTANRVLGYSDAVMATCATFLVIPIRNLKKMEKDQSLSDFIYSIRTEVVMFFLGFAVVLTIWENMNIRTTVIKRVDDFIIIILILELLATTVLPFSLALQGHFPSEKISVVVTCSVLGLIQILDAMLILYAMATPRVLHIELQKWTVYELSKFRNIFIAKPLISLGLIIVGAVFCFVHYAVSWALISILTIIPTIFKIYFYFYRRVYFSETREMHPFYSYFSKGNVSKERVEVMSDAAIAIISCILILDITTEDFPLISEVNEYGLIFVLKHMRAEFCKFLTAFAMVSTLWYINHTVLHLFSSVSTITLYLQKAFLAFTCLSPLAANMALKFATKGNANSMIGIRFAAVIIFLASLSNFFILLYGLLMEKKYLHQWAVLGPFKQNARQQIYTMLKSLNVPFWSLLCLIGTMSSAKAALYFLYFCFTGTLTSIFLGKLVFMIHLGKDESRELRISKTVPYSQSI